MRTLLFSMKEQSPAVEIPEGVFYNGVPNINIYVQRKNTLTGMLYQTIIYKTDQGFDRAQIVLADSARLEVTRDKMHLRLELWNGEQFESLESSGGAATQMMQNGAHEPFDREKLIKGIFSAIKKRPVSIDRVSSIADHVENYFANELKSVAKSKEIGELVLEQLKDIDPISYIRFASVYEDFTDIESFISVISELDKNKDPSAP